MFAWKKLGIIFDPSKYANDQWISEFAQAPSCLVFESFVRVYFSCRPKPDQNGQYVSYSAFVDLERKNLFNIIRISEKPVLSLGELGTFDEFGTYPISVIRDQTQIVAYYGGWTRCESVPFNVAIGIAISDDDGTTFNRIGNGPVLSYTPDEPFILSGPKIRHYNNKWYLWYIAGTKWIIDSNRPEPVYKIRMAVSNNLLDWNKIGKPLIADKYGEFEAQASPDVFHLNGKYHMFFCYRQASDYRTNKNRSYRIGYASSHDLLNWIRDDSQAGIDVSETGWDSQMIAYPHILELDGNIYMLYLGNNVGKHGFGIAQLESIS